MAGIFILTLDTELAWGTFDKKGLIKYKKHFSNYRKNIDRLIKLLERYQIKATWAFVGHLFLDSCEKINGITHPDVLRPKYSWYERDWHFYDPGTNIDKDPFWYGKDILEKVKKMSPSQEIACHTFSHVIIDDKSCAKSIAYSQIKKCLDLAKKEDIHIKSLVFPRSKIGHLDVLKKLGITSFRGLEINFYQKFPKEIKKLFYILDQIFSRTPPVYSPKDLINHNGILEIPASMFLMPYDGVRKIIPSFSRRIKAKKGLKKAIANDSIFHLWFHPFNLGSSEKMFKDLEYIFQAVKDNKITSMTMSEIADLYE